MENFIKEIQHQAKINKILLNEKQCELFYKYMNILLKWNENINLTAITKQDEIILKHFIDCMTILPYIQDKDKIIDVGTGAGFPGIPIKIMREDAEILLVDSLNKRIQFLNETIEMLNLQNIQTIHSRAEDLAINSNKREYYDIATSRAVAKLNVLLEYLLPFVKVNGKCICMKSNNIEDEIKEAKNAIKILGGEIEKIEDVKLGNTDIIRKIIVIRKIKNTPKNFPRKAGIPVKKPL